MIKQLRRKIPFAIRKWIILTAHSGKKYKCPFCNYSSRDLAPIGLDISVLNEKKVIGAGKRLGKCYKCGSIDRERLVYIYLKDKLRLFELNNNKKILHISPENSISEKLLDFGFEEYVCGVLHESGVSYPEHVENINILDIPYKDNTFDLVICSHVLEHVSDDLTAIHEFLRVLKTGGKAILQVPISNVLEKTFEDFSITDPQEREKVFGQYNHVRIYGQDYKNRLERSGFKVDRINISKEFIQYGLIEDEDLFICVK